MHLATASVVLALALLVLCFIPWLEPATQAEEGACKDEAGPTVDLKPQA